MLTVDLPASFGKNRKIKPRKARRKRNGQASQCGAALGLQRESGPWSRRNIMKGERPRLQRRSWVSWFFEEGKRGDGRSGSAFERYKKDKYTGRFKSARVREFPELKKNRS